MERGTEKEMFGGLKALAGLCGAVSELDPTLEGAHHSPPGPVIWS